MNTAILFAAVALATSGGDAWKKDSGLNAEEGDPLASRPMMRKVVDRTFAALKLADERVRSLSDGLLAAIGKGERGKSG